MNEWKKLNRSGFEQLQKVPACSAAQALGLHQANQQVHVFPENWGAFVLCSRLATQWNVGMGGATGLRYEAAFPLIDRAAKSPEEWEQLFDDLQVLEGAALKQMSDNRSDT